VISDGAISMDVVVVAAADNDDDDGGGDTVAPLEVFAVNNIVININHYQTQRPHNVHLH